jgi:myosin heavy subunit
MATLRKTVPHYIKCIKPNDMKQPNTIEPMLVLEQLRYSGFLEAVRIRREGFPIRSTFIDFIEYNVFTKRKCQELCPELDGYGDNSQQVVVRDCCSRLAAMILPVNQFQIGHSMIFLRPEALQLLDSEEYDFFERHCTLLQSRIRTFLQRKIFKKLIDSIEECEKKQIRNQWSHRLHFG